MNHAPSPTLDVLTTTKVARRLRVSTGTVANLANKGLIKFWLVPGSRHRRFLGSDVEEFARRHGVPGDLLGVHPQDDVDTPRLGVPGR